MIRERKKGSRALWAVAFAAAPIGATHATPIINPPKASCNSDGQVDQISWQNGSFVGGKQDVLGATVRGTGGGETKGSTSVNVPFDCIQTKGDGFDGSKTGTKSGGSAASVFASAELSKGQSFSIDFGPLEQTGSITKGDGFPTKDVIDFVPTFTAFDYETTLGGIGTLKGGGESKGEQVWVTDFNLDLNATDPLNGDVLFTDFLGVQVISGASALSSNDSFFFNKADQLIFDPGIDGQTKVNLYSEPLSPAVPEPSALALFGAGLLGLAALVRRRRKDDAGGGEPEA